MRSSYLRHCGGADAVVIAMTLGARGLEAAIQAKQLAPETPLVWWSDDENFALIAYRLLYPGIPLHRL